MCAYIHYTYINVLPAFVTISSQDRSTVVALTYHILFHITSKPAVK